MSFINEMIDSVKLCTFVEPSDDGNEKFQDSIEQRFLLDLKMKKILKSML